MTKRIGRIPTEPVIRFWAKVDKLSSCWEWSGCRNSRGYGLFNNGQKLVIASRFSWELEHSSIPAGLLVCHHCDNPPCVRPDHLFLGTHRDNSNDKVAKGRQATGPQVKWVARGERHGRAVLSELQVAEIRHLHSSGEWSQRELARHFGVSRGAIVKVIRHMSWTHAQ